MAKSTATPSCRTRGNSPATAFAWARPPYYTTIQRLLDQALIEEVSGEAGADSRRRYYKLAKEGRALLMLELTRMDSLVRKAKTMRLAESR